MEELACELSRKYSRSDLLISRPSGYKFAELEMSAYLSCNPHGILLNGITEVVLSTLLEAFVFELPVDKEIHWNLAGIQYPSVGIVSTKAEMPLRTSRVSPD